LTFTANPPIMPGKVTPGGYLLLQNKEEES